MAALYVGHPEATDAGTSGLDGQGKPGHDILGFTRPEASGGRERRRS